MSQLSAQAAAAAARTADGAAPGGAPPAAVAQDAVTPDAVGPDAVGRDGVGPDGVGPDGVGPDSGVREAIDDAAPVGLTPNGAEARAPQAFRTAVESLERAVTRAEVRVEAIRAPQRLAPYSYALAADVMSEDDGEGATGRLVLLHDPDGADAWDGELRLVAFATAELAADMVGDPLLPEVGWSWLTGALAEHGAGYTAAGGTVTQTTSTRFGDVHGPSSTTSLELRGSWTPTSADLTAHLLAFVDVLATAAGLPPEGVTALTRS